MEVFISLEKSFGIWYQQVSDEGDVRYVFPKDRSKLAAKSLWIKYEPLVEKAKVLPLYLLHVCVSLEESMLGDPSVYQNILFFYSMMQ